MGFQPIFFPTHFAKILNGGSIFLLLDSQKVSSSRFPFFIVFLFRYPFIKQEILKNMPYIDCLYMDLNCIIYKCVKDETTFLKEFISAAQ